MGPLFKCHSGSGHRIIASYFWSAINPEYNPNRGGTNSGRHAMQFTYLHNSHASITTQRPCNEQKPTPNQLLFIRITIPIPFQHRNRSPGRWRKASGPIERLRSRNGQTPRIPTNQPQNARKNQGDSPPPTQRRRRKPLVHGDEACVTLPRAWRMART